MRFLCGFHKEWERVSKREMMKRAGSDKRRSASGLAPLEWIARLAPWSQLFSAAPVHRSGFKFVVGVGVCVAGPHRFGLAVVRSRIARTDTGWMTSPAWAPVTTITTTLPSCYCYTQSLCYPSSLSSSTCCSLIHSSRLSMLSCYLQYSIAISSSSSLLLSLRCSPALR